MSEQAHTPGPWTADDDGIIAEGDCEYHEVARVVPAPSCRLPDEVAANASLIAAAPELLAVAVQLVSRGIADAPTMDKARAAIAKATGLPAAGVSDAEKR